MAGSPPSEGASQSPRKCISDSWLKITGLDLPTQSAGHEVGKGVASPVLAAAFVLSMTPQRWPWPPEQGFFQQHRCWSLCLGMSFVYDFLAPESCEGKGHPQVS